MANGELNRIQRNQALQQSSIQVGPEAAAVTDNALTYAGQRGNPNSNLY